MKKVRGQHARFLEKVAVKAERRDHIPGVMGHLCDGLALAAKRGQRLHDRLHPYAIHSAGTPEPARSGGPGCPR